MTTSCCPSCYNGPCPELTPVTIEQNTYYISGFTVEMRIEYTEMEADPITGIEHGIEALVTIQVVDPDGEPVAQRVQLDLHFIDGPTDLGVPSVSPPKIPGWREKTVFTNANGYFALPVHHDTPDRDWHLVVTCGGLPFVSYSIELGVP